MMEDDAWFRHAGLCIVCRGACTIAEEDAEPVIRIRVPEMCVEGAVLFVEAFPRERTPQ